MPLYWIESGEIVLSIVQKWLNIDNYIQFELKVLELRYLIHFIPQNIAIQTKKMYSLPKFCISNNISCAQNR